MVMCVFVLEHRNPSFSCFYVFVHSSWVSVNRGLLMDSGVDQLPGDRHPVCVCMRERERERDM